MAETESNKLHPMRGLSAWARDHSKMILLVGGLLLLAYWTLRGYLPALGGSLLPPSVMDSIERGYRVCIMDIDIQPGETRQPSCGDVRVVVQAQGSVPSQQARAGITRAVCYKVDITTPVWTTQGTTRHELDWHGRRVSKVAVLQSGEWVLFPDEDARDAARWVQFACPTLYEAGPTPEANPG
jgi:hypothetical protein